MLIPLVFATGNPVIPLLMSSLMAHGPSEHSSHVLGMLRFFACVWTDSTHTSVIKADRIPVDPGPFFATFKVPC